jgi:Ca-activated chloride channel homolog
MAKRCTCSPDCLPKQRSHLSSFAKTLIKEAEHEVSSAKPISITWDTDGIVARLCAAAQIGELTEGKADTKLAKSLAMKYQLVTQHTNLFLLHERAEENKAEGLPQLQQVAQMQAAGFGGYGTVGRAAPSLSVMRMSCHSEAFEISDSLSTTKLGGDYDRLNTPSVWRTNRTQSASKLDAMASTGMDDIEIPAFLRKQAPTLDEMIPYSQANNEVHYKDTQSTKPSEATKVDIALAPQQCFTSRLIIPHCLAANVET